MVLINSTDRLQQPYVRTQLAIATASITNLNNKATTKLRKVNNIIEKKENNKVITSSEHSKTYFRSNSVICVIRRGKSLDKKEEKAVKNSYITPKGVISRLYTSSKQMKLARYRLASTKEMNECRPYKLACTEQPYVCSQQEAVVRLSLIHI